METKTIPVRRKDFIWREVDGETVIISSDNKLMHVLNETATMIWLLLDGNHDQDSIAEIVAIIFTTLASIILITVLHNKKRRKEI